MGDAQFNQRILLPGDPTVNLHAATKQYVDARPGVNVTVSNTAPSNPGNGDLWVDTSTPVWTNATLVPSWQNYDGGYPWAGYQKDAFGVVRLTGLVRWGAVGSVIFVLPVGYRPTIDHIYVAWADGGTARVDTKPWGDVMLVAYGPGGNNGFVSLDGISFATF